MGWVRRVKGRGGERLAGELVERVVEKLGEMKAAGGGAAVEIALERGGRLPYALDRRLRRAESPEAASPMQRESLVRKQDVILCAVVAFVAGGQAAAQVQFVDNLPGTFIDISPAGSGAGIALNIPDDGTADILTTIGNGLFDAGTWRIGNNGGMGLDVPGALGLPPAPGANLPLPDPLVFGGQAPALLPGWDNEGDTSGAIYWAEVGNRLIVQWDGVSVGDAGNTTTFQVQVIGGVPLLGEPYAQFAYRDVDQTPFPASGEIFTIGYQDGLDFGTSWTNRPVRNGTVLSLVNVPGPGVLSLIPAGILLVARRRR